MALSDRWGWRDPLQRKNDAISFLAGGSSFRELNIIGGDTSSGRCRDSNDCGSGWACNGGTCQQTDASSTENAGSGDASDCGDGGTGGGGQCAPGPDEFLDSEVSKCLKTGCGDDEGNIGPDGCCGDEKCCRFDAYGIVQCFCGDCPEPESTCDPWCSSYSAATGEEGAGCSDMNVCDECDECRENGSGGNSCQAQNSGAPCHCGGGNACSEADCEACGEDGLCAEDCENCERCYVTQVECSCGIVEKECCYSACDQTSGYPECRASIDCDDHCPPAEGGCTQNCNGVSWCDGETPEPPCPAGYTCTSNGSMTAGERTCHFRTDCGPAEEESAETLACNCNLDCNNCQTCVNGYCVGDQLCPGE